MALWFLVGGFWGGGQLTAEVVQPLIALLRPKADFRWTSEDQTASKSLYGHVLRCGGGGHGRPAPQLTLAPVMTMVMIAALGPHV